MQFTAPTFIVILALSLNQLAEKQSYNNVRRSKEYSQLMGQVKVQALYSIYKSRNAVITNGPKSTCSSLKFITTILMLCGDININPGPRNVKYPCQVCDKAVKWKTRALACDNCSKWYHVDCLRMNSNVYEALANTSLEWICYHCGFPNFSSSLFAETFAESSNSYSILSSDSSDFNKDDEHNVAPKFASTPKAKQHKEIKRKGPCTAENPKSISSKGDTKNSKHVKILVTNFQGILSKKENLINLIDSTDPDIVIASETWLNSSIKNSEIFQPYVYEVSRKDRPDGYGGVLIAAKKSLNSQELSVKLTGEQIWVKISRKRKSPILIGSLYRPPKSDLEYIQQMRQGAESMITRNKNAILWIGGDLNLPDIDWNSCVIQSHQYTKEINEEFLSFLDDNSLQQMVATPTRKTNILDLFLTNRPSLLNRCEVIPGISDHEAVFVNMNIEPHRSKPTKRKILLWKKADFDVINRLLEEYRDKFINEFKESTPVEEMWQSFRNHCKHIIEKHVPSKLSSSRFHQPWINKKIKRLSKRKQRLYNRAKRSGKEKDWSCYNNLKKQQKLECRKAHNNYVSNIICPEINAKPKKFWSYIKSKRCDAVGVSSLRANDGITYTDSKSKANILNKQFESVFCADDQLNRAELPHLGINISNEISCINIDQEGVLKLLKCLDPNKAPGPDEIPAHLLKECAGSIAPVLTKIYQASINQGSVPSDWTKANVTPLFKKGDRSNPGNYRPISLTCVACKVLEHIVCSKVMDHLESYNLLSDAQHGFRRHRSCESQLILCINDIAKSLDSGDQTDAILLDFQKAFDKVSHLKLLHKLNQYGIRGQLNQWVSSFLSNRSQSVVLEGARSKEVAVASGVPQGSVLGPLLFSIFINDLPSVVSSHVRLFADDCIIYRKIKKNEDALAFQVDLNQLQSWAKQWSMSFHPEKCELLRVTNKRQPTKTSYVMSEHTLKEVNDKKYLGITINDKLKWNKQVQTVCTKANNTLSLLRRNMGSCPRAVKQSCYTSLVRPILEYSSTVWDPYTKQNIDKIEMLQRRAARFVVGNYSYHASPTAMMKELGWQALAERRAKAKAVMMYKIQNNLIAIPQHLFQNYSRHSRRSQAVFILPFCRTDCYKFSFVPTSVKIWNELPPSIRESQSLNNFKAALDDINVSSYY